ncbi:MAG: hypothetical protein ACXW29_06530, partial [Thermoanaerobaculia bacterium]
AASVAGCGDGLPTSPQNSLRSGVWGSNEASLIVNDSTATLQIVAGPGCFGSYGEIGQPMPPARFTLRGTYTQLMGVSPGKVQYVAEYSGIVEGSQISITVTVPSLQQSFGPFRLTYGGNSNLVPCLFP